MSAVVDLSDYVGGLSPAPAVPILDLEQLRAQAQAIRWLVKHVVPEESLGIMFGGSGTFKSFIAIDLAMHVAHGLRWMGRKTTRGPVLFIAAEGGSGLWRRIQAWHQAYGLDWTEALAYVVPTSMDLATMASAVREAATANGITPVLVVVDTLSQTFAGEENSAQEVSAYLRELGVQFRLVWQCAVLVIHHTGHQATERPRGSSALRSNVDFMLGVFRDEREMIATVECHKQKDGELFEAQTFKLASLEIARDEDNDPITSLVARRLVDGAEVLQAMAVEGAKGRKGRNQLLLELAKDGQTEKELRQAFYESCDIDNAEARRQAFHRALQWAVRQGFASTTDGRISIIKSNGAPHNQWWQRDSEGPET